MGTRTSETAADPLHLTVATTSDFTIYSDRSGAVIALVAAAAGVDVRARPNWCHTGTLRPDSDMDPLGHRWRPCTAHGQRHVRMFVAAVVVGALADSVDSSRG